MNNAEILKRAAELLLNYPEATFHAWDRPTAEIRYFAAALEAMAAQPQQAPDDWQFVPIEPTVTMLAASGLPAISARAVYIAMLAAAPKEPK